MSVDPAAWFKSSYSNGNVECVEVAHRSEAVSVRDSKRLDGPYLTLSPEAWAGLVALARRANG
ncbi:DUF397 domain-containing protein [Streptomyces sp. NPDC057638]|uniref:DUF397 domain-containing protein n=1 Tax=Streptomyces sp. NPDC057638 TaxID=3346190 RepID=UPI0036A27661